MSKSSYRTIFGALVFLLLVGFIYFLPSAGREKTRAVAGALVILPQEDLVALDGEWARYAFIDDGTSGTFEHYDALPATWGRKRFGAARYSLRVDGLIPGRTYSLALPYQATAWALSIDDSVVAGNGHVGSSRAQSLPAYMPKVVSFVPEQSSVVLSLSVSNFHHRRGGPFQRIWIGSERAIATKTLWDSARAWAFIAIWGSMGLYQLAFFFLRRDRALLYLGLFFLGIAANGFVDTPEVLVFRVFELLPWGLYQRLCYWTSYLAPIFLFLFVQNLYGGVSRKMVVGLGLPLLAISLFVAVTPVWVFSRLNPVFQIYAVFYMGLICALLLRAVRVNAPGARAFFSGFILIVAILLGGLYFSNDRIAGEPFLPLSFLAWYFPHFANAGALSIQALSWILSLLLLNILSLVYFLKNPAVSKVPAVSPLVPASIQTRPADDTVSQARALGFSPREIEIALLLLTGFSNARICEELSISMSTVKTHISRIFRKAGVSSRTELFFLFNIKDESPE